MKNLRLGLLALALATISAPALALMPPHVTSAGDPSGVMKGDTVVFHGYSLGYAPGDAKARDVTADKDIAVSATVDCTWEGKGDCPGCQQQRCEVKVKLAEVVPGHVYEVTFMDTTARVTARATARAPDPAKPAKKATPDAPAPDAPSPN